MNSMNLTRAITMFLLLLMIVIGVAGCINYDLKVENKTDEVLDIYVDGFYEGAVAPNNHLIINNLSSGEHDIQAINLDDEVLAEDTIYLDQDSRWVIYDDYFNFY